ncbi:Uncharacterised protein [Raoultella ornithinolytica]|nr:Uncharacterised protein [Raoultella ornithinolytica]
MALTEFGKAVRKARIDTDCTLLTMAQTLGVTSAFLSGLETGSKKIPKKWVKEIQAFFKVRGYELGNLQELADVSNQFVSLDGFISEPADVSSWICKISSDTGAAKAHSRADEKHKPY